MIVHINTKAQTEVLGDWYLYSISVDNTTSYNQELYTIDYPNLRIITENGISTFEGGVCNAYFSNYLTINTNTIEIYGVASTNGPCNSDAIQQFEHAYFQILASPLDYEITGTGLDETLVLTNMITSNYAVLGRRSRPTDIIGDWYLYSTTVQGVNLYNAQFGNGQPKIAFTNDYGYTSFLYDGLSCNDFFGEYIFNLDGTLRKLDFSTTLVFCDNNNTDEFKSSYINDVLGATDETTFSYDIVMNGDEQTLILTNTDNSNYATFGNTQQTPSMIGDWFLHYLIVDSNQINIPGFAIPTINFSTNSDSTGLFFDGFAICTGYAGNYYFNPEQTFSTDGSLSVTLGDPCDNAEENNFENLYLYSVLDTGVNNEFDYQITGTGDDATLSVINLSNGNQAFFGRQALSVDDVELNLSQLKIDQNPVTNIIDFSEDYNDATYEIYSISGRLVMNGNITSNSLPVIQLQSGLYFIKVYNSSIQFETLKFIKE
ncbi:META domain-containing protein [uncultured Psychroserpens sp.]|uniref:META domain-containing protein n=1 Tax=uncultured Psychroserpens sp. TaxID=255436 RepID=UPI00262D40F7|nr:META domain-containing protein [uncultured Psychroserpens sp.]